MTPKFKNEIYNHYLTISSENLQKYSADSFENQVPMFEAYYLRFLPADKEAKILDLACGSGAFVWYLQQNGYKNAFGIDISQEQIMVGKKQGISNIEIADLKDFLKNQDSQYEFISAHDIIEHFAKAEIEEILELVYKSLKPAGVFLVSVPNAESLFSARIRYSDFTHEIAFTPTSISMILRFAGFDEIKIFPKEPYIHGLRSFLRFILWKIIKQFIRFYFLIETGSIGTGVYTQTMYVVGKK